MHITIIDFSKELFDIHLGLKDIKFTDVIRLGKRKDDNRIRLGPLLVKLA